MKVPFIDLQAQYHSIKDEVDDAIQKVIDGGSFIGGEIVTGFEKSFADYIGTTHCIGCANGTDALEIALMAFGIGKGDEVVVPALSWISTAEAVSNVGAVPVFVDVLELEKTIDSSKIETKISPKTKAIIPVHLYGLPARMEDINTIAKKYNLKVIEDCAQAHGASIEGQKVGTFGDVATFSFYPTKNLGAYGDGGAILTSNDGLSEMCRRITNHGQLSKHGHEMLGRNSRLDTMQAAILSVKLNHLDKWIEKRISLAKIYSSNLSNVLVPMVTKESKHVFHLFVIQSAYRDAMKSFLEEEGIMTHIHYPKPLPFLEPYKYLDHHKGDFPVAEKLSQQVLSLPLYPELGEGNLDLICSFINSQANI